MPGTFSKTARPRRPGAYFNFEAVTVPAVPPSTASTVAIIATADWGPLATPTLVTSFSEYLAVFGPSTDTQGYQAAFQAFRGEGVNGRNGAGGLLVYRIGSSAAAKAALTLDNTSDADAVTLTARYEGDYGENIEVSTGDWSADNTLDAVQVSVNGVQVEEFHYAPTDITALVADINANSDWVSAAVVASGTALKQVTDQALAAGNDGTTVAAADVTDALGALETYRFALFCMADLAGTTYASPTTATDILASIVTWAVGTEAAPGLNRKGKRFVTVVGGALDEAASVANSRSTDDCAESDVVNVGVGGVEDEVLGTLSTSQLAPRVAGILAGRGETGSITFARLAGVTARNFASESDILDSFDAGTVVLSQDTDPAAPVRIEKALTTWTDTSDTSKPYIIYRNPKFVRTIHGIESDLTEWAEQNVVGQLQVNDATRSYVVGESSRQIKNREDVGVLQPSSTIGIDPDPPPSDDDEYVQVLYGVRFGRSVEQVFNTVRIG